MTRWNHRTYLQAMQFEHDETATPREVRLSDAAPRPGDPVRVKVAGVEVEGQIVEIEASVLHVRVGRKLY